MAPRYASKLTYGNEISDWQERLNTERMRRERAERAKRIMREHGIPALLDTSSKIPSPLLRKSRSGSAS